MPGTRSIMGLLSTQGQVSLRQIARYCQIANLNVIKILYMLILSTKALQVISPIISISPNPITDQMELDQIWSTGLTDNTDNDFPIISLWE